MVNKLRVCVVGGGRIGTIHMEAVQRSPRMVLRFFVDVDEKRRSEIVEQYENVKSFPTFAEIVENEETRNELDAVIVCSPTACHFETVMLCIEHKKPVMCEKPLSMKVDEIIVAYQKAKDHNVPLLTGLLFFASTLFFALTICNNFLTILLTLGYHRRHDASFCELERSIREGLIGDLRAIRSCSRDNPFPAMSFLKISGQF
jgi:myo-inositol 2-dehydrogenase / D-chiro-inositol 1-dehydrogenase